MNMIDQRASPTTVGVQVSRGVLGTGQRRGGDIWLDLSKPIVRSKGLRRGEAGSELGRPRLMALSYPSTEFHQTFLLPSAARYFPLLSIISSLFLLTPVFPPYSPHLLCYNIVTYRVARYSEPFFVFPLPHMCSLSIAHTIS